MSTSMTPLSDLISALVASPSDEAFAELFRAFLDASVGVKLANVPAHAEGAYRIAAQDRVTMAFVHTPDGRSMVKACADPRVFSQKYAGAINAEMRGRQMLEMVLKVPELDGVLVCSAASFHSVPVSRAAIPGLLGL